MASPTEWSAEGYSTISGLQSAMASEVLGLLSLNGTENILDVGCGDGKVTAQIASRVPRGTVVGVDQSTEMVRYASDRFGTGAWPNLRFQTADARHLGFSEEFDLVVSLNALHWVPDQEAALRSIQAALKPGGLAQLRLVPRGERKSLEEVIEETRRSSRWSAYFREFSDPYLRLTPEQYRAVAERSGLRVASVEVTSKIWNFPSRAAFEEFGSVTFVAWTRLLPEDKESAFVSDVLDRYLDGQNGANTFRFYQMDVQAERYETPGGTNANRADVSE